MKKAEINKLTIDEINKKVFLFKKDLFNIRFKKVNGQLEDTAKISTLKKDIARLLTKLKGKK